MPQVVVPPPYRGPTGGRGEFDAAGTSVRECLEDVERRHPGFAEQIFDGCGNVHRFVSVFLNGDEIERGDVDRTVAEGDRIEILAAVAGG
jgi:sulfur carrier protein ThiS